MKHIALIPSYQPDDALPEVVRSLERCGFSCVVVDDGSSAETKKYFEEIGPDAVLLVHEINRGKGQALRTGLTYIRDHFEPPYTVVTVDGDGQHSADDAARLTEEAEEHPEAMILGKRNFTNSVPFRSRFGNAVTRIVFFFSSGVKVYDTQTGLRAFSDQAVQDLIDVQGDRYEYEMNALLFFARHKIPIREIGIETIYIDGNHKSHFRVLADSFRIYKDILKFSASSFVSFLTDYLIYTLLVLFTKNLVLSNVIARVVSGTLNFSLNHFVVFKSRENVWKAALKYLLLALSMLAVNTLILKLFAEVVGLHAMIAKILTEFICFFVNFTVQRLLIFKAREKRK